MNTKDIKYLDDLAHSLHLDLSVVLFFAELLGPNEYYDALPTILEEYKSLGWI